MTEYYVRNDDSGQGTSYNVRFVGKHRFVNGYCAELKIWYYSDEGTRLLEEEGRKLDERNERLATSRALDDAWDRSMGSILDKDSVPYLNATSSTRFDLVHPKTTSYTIATAYNYTSDDRWEAGIHIPSKFYKVLYKIVYGPFSTKSQAEAARETVNDRNSDVGLPRDAWITCLKDRWYVQCFANEDLSLVKGWLGKIGGGPNAADYSGEMDAANQKIKQLEARNRELEALLAQLRAQKQEVRQPEIRNITTTLTNSRSVTNVVYVDESLKFRAEDAIKAAEKAYQEFVAKITECTPELSEAGKNQVENTRKSILDTITKAKDDFKAGKYQLALQNANGASSASRQGAMAVCQSAYKNNYDSFATKINSIDMENSVEALATLDSIEAEATREGGAFKRSKARFENALAIAKNAGVDVSREEKIDYLSDLIAMIKAKRDLIMAQLSKMKATPHITFGMLVSDQLIESKTHEELSRIIRARKYVMGKGQTIFKLSDRAATVNSEQNKKLDAYFTICDGLMGNKALVEKAKFYYKKIIKALRGYDMKFEDAYAIERKYGIIHAASLALAWAYADGNNDFDADFRNRILKKVKDSDASALTPADVMISEYHYSTMTKK